MSKTLSYAKYIEWANEFRKYFENVCFGDDSYYYNCFHNMLENETNNYINYLNFKNIHGLLKNKSNLKILDLGCGIGDKSCILKKIFPDFNIYGLETLMHDDPDHVRNRPQEFYKKIFEFISNKHNISLNLYDGNNIEKEDEYFDVILLFAVIEHIAPMNRKNFIDNIEKKLKINGQIIVTRCPRKFGLIEFISRIFKLGSHEWVLSRKDLLKLFDEKEFVVEKLFILNNIPNNYKVSKLLSKPLIILDKFLQIISWPFATDYYLAVRKIK